MKIQDIKNLITKWTNTTWKLALLTWTIIIGMHIKSESKDIERHNENNETRLENIELRQQLEFHKNVIRVLEEENGKDVEQAERDVRGW